MTVVLGIESSCDETALAVLEEAGNGAKIRAEIVASQADLHARYGGVVPELASREHMRVLPFLLQQVLEKAATRLDEIDLLAVTSGPGLQGCLLMGMSFGKGLEAGCRARIESVNHIEGHILSVELENPELKPPYLALVVSGGHTELVAVEAPGRYRILARTQDDAAGEAFDKSAALLGFAYPGGAALAKLADSAEQTRFSLPKVGREIESFTFSGLKTAVSLLVRKHRETIDSDPAVRAEAAFAIQGAIVDALVWKTRKALNETGCNVLSVSGGVAANGLLRKRLGDLPNIRAFFPRPAHTGDNAAMIAYVGLERFRNARLQGSQSVRPRWQIEEVR